MIWESEVHKYQGYIKRRLEKNDFQVLKNYDSTKGAKEITYLLLVADLY